MSETLRAPSDPRTRSQDDPLGDEEARRVAFERAVRSTRMPMVLVDARAPDLPIAFANASFERLTGYRESEVLGRNCRFLQGPTTDARAVAEVRAAIAERRTVEVELQNHRKDGAAFWNRLFISPVYDDGELLFFFGSMADVSERVALARRLAHSHDELERRVRERTAELEALSAQREALLHEMQHRTRNNLQLIGSLIAIQAGRVKEPAASAAFADLRSRVDVLTTLYQLAPADAAGNAVDFAAYLDKVCAKAAMVYDPQARVRLQVEAAPCRVATDRAVPLGMIANELVANCYKHAFDAAAAGTVRVGLAAGERGRFRLSVADDGRGEPADAALHEGGLGLSLVRSLVKQVDGSFTIAGEGGCVAAVEFAAAAQR